MQNTKTKSPAAVEHIRELLNQGRTEDALNFIDHLGQKTPVFENARGVCLLRLGKIDRAVSVLRDVVFQSYVCIPPETPVLYQANFATAMLMANYKDSAFSVLDKLDDEQYPQVKLLKSAVKKWETGLSILGKIGCAFGFYPSKSVLIDFVPGDI